MSKYMHVCLSERTPLVVNMHEKGEGEWSPLLKTVGLPPVIYKSVG